MNLFDKLASDKTVLITSIVMGTFIIYPNINDLLWHAKYDDAEFMIFFFCRYLFFCVFIWILLSVNIRRMNSPAFSKRMLKTLLLSIIAYAIYAFMSLAVLSRHVDCFTGILLFQFVVTCLLCTLTGHVFAMYNEQKNRELEIEQLKTENLQSRYNALSSQVNPHFFFNSLNSISALVREGKKTQTLEYIHKLSGVFRYILQSDKKGLVCLKEELDFLAAMRYMFEVRYANKLRFSINVPEEKQELLMIPVLSLLPLVENIMKHNVIDSDNTMTILIVLNDRDELIISNPIHEKIDMLNCNGIGLANLSERFTLLTTKKVIIEKGNSDFKVILPLITTKNNANNSPAKQ
ncbi:MAG: histidine kinase [Prevotellaceae bacterium]|jgi:sensor histidine kinase YesM|nr:histidine kinase [Prevotellaceae bacterium]